MKAPCPVCGRLFCKSVTDNAACDRPTLCTCEQEGWPHPACDEHGGMWEGRLADPGATDWRDRSYGRLQEYVTRIDNASIAIKAILKELRRGR